MNLYNEQTFKRLVDTVLKSYKDMESFRKNGKDLVESFIGSEYEVADKTVQDTYLNMLALAVNIYMRQLAVRAPSAVVTTPFENLRPLAYSLSIACADAAEECELGLVLRRAVMSALFFPFAMVKVGLEYNGTDEYNGEQIDITDPFVRNISFDDTVIDMSARSAYNPAFIGNRYYIPVEKFKETYPNASLPKDYKDNKGVKSQGAETRTSEISHKSNGDEDFQDMIELWDIWLTGERKLVTYFANFTTKKPINVIEDFDASEKGPYRRLFFTGVPDNAMPLPPFGLVKNLHDLANHIFRRLAFQAKNKKSVEMFDNPESAELFNKALDGMAIVGTGAEPQHIETGGIDQPSFQLMLQVRDMFSWAAGNIDSLGGLSPMSDTATQDKLLASSASAQIRDMQDATSDFARSIFEQIAWYEWTDPIRTRIIEKPIPHTDVVIPVEWSPETRQGDFLDLNFDIIPQSMRDETPAQKLNDMMTILNQIIMPMYPLLQQQGVSIDTQRLISIISDYSNIPELEQVLVSASDTEMMQPEGNPQPMLMGGKPQSTTRQYDRVVRPGATRQGNDYAMSQALMGMGVQKDQMNATQRGVS